MPTAPRMPTALISGASTGIGRATALRLAKAGWKVLAGVRAPEAGERLTAAADAGVGAAQGSGGAAGQLTPFALDITDEGEIAQAAEVVREHVGGAGLDALINNAGISVGGPLELISMQDLRRQFDVNFFGHIALTQALLGALRDAHGRIVFISSVGGRVAVPYSVPYGASKHAIEVVGDSLRIELHSSHIQVTLIEPGSVATPIWDKSRKQGELLVIPPGLQAQYGHIQAKMDAVLVQTAQRGVPPERVAETIERALGAKRMRSRYLVGSDARAMVMARALLSDRVFDWIVRHRLGV